MGIKFKLVHRQIKSGGRDVFVTQIEHSDDFSSYVMKTIQQGIESKQQLMLEGKGNSIIEPALMLEESVDSADGDEGPDTPALMSNEDEKQVAADFVADAGKTDKGLDAAAATLLKNQ